MAGPMSETMSKSKSEGSVPRVAWLQRTAIPESEVAASDDADADPEAPLLGRRNPREEEQRHMRKARRRCVPKWPLDSSNSAKERECYAPLTDMPSDDPSRGPHFRYEVNDMVSERRNTDMRETDSTIFCQTAPRLTLSTPLHSFLLSCVFVDEDGVRGQRGEEDREVSRKKARQEWVDEHEDLGDDVPGEWVLLGADPDAVVGVRCGRRVGVRHIAPGERQDHRVDADGAEDLGHPAHACRLHLGLLPREDNQHLVDLEARHPAAADEHRESHIHVHTRTLEKVL